MNCLANIALVVAVSMSACSSESSTPALTTRALTTPALTTPAVTPSPTVTQPVATPAPTTAAPTTAEPTTAAATTAAATTAIPTTAGQVAPAYVFPFVGRKVSYGTTHAGYPAIDVFGCGAGVVAPTSGTIAQIRLTDPWEAGVNDPATRGGKYVAMIGHDGVRYYFAHLASIAVTVGNTVAAGDALGVMGQTGDARSTVCHTHFGVSWPCPTNEWQVRRGEIWPTKYLDAWRNGEQLSPAGEVTATQASKPNACADAAAAKSAAAA